MGKRHCISELVLQTQGLKHREIAETTDFAVTYISELVQKHCQYGLTSIIENHYQGNHRNLSFREEEELLAPFQDATASGQMVGISEIKAAYEAATFKSLDNNHGHIYQGSNGMDGAK